MAYFSTRNIDMPYLSVYVDTITSGNIVKTSLNDVTWSGYLNIIFNSVTSSTSSNTSPGTWSAAGCRVGIEVLFYTEGGTHFSTQTLIDKTIYKPQESHTSLYNRGKMYSWEMYNATVDEYVGPPSAVIGMSYTEMYNYLDDAGYRAQGTGGYFVTQEPFGKRFLSDGSGTVYQPRSVTTSPTWYPSIFRNDSGSQNVNINFDAPENAAYFRIRITGYNGTGSSSTGSYTYPESASMPTDETFLLDLESKGYYKWNDVWSDTARFWTKASGTWQEEADGYTKASGSWKKSK